MTRYKLREEKQGASLFDNSSGATIFLREEEYRDVINGRSVSFSWLYGTDARPLFDVFKAKDREGLPDDCLSAPSKVYFEITRKCNLNCVYCYNSSRKNFSEELNKRAIFDLLDELEDAGTFEIRLTGGEPTLHPNFFEILDYLGNRNFFVSLGTNGLWKSGERVRILDSGIKIIIVSLDGPEAYNDRIRGKGNFKRVVRTMHSIKEKKEAKLKMNSVVCKENLAYIDEIIDMADALNVDSLNVGPLRSSGRAGNSISLTPLDSTDMFHIVTRITERRKTCRVRIQTYFDIIEPPPATEKFPSSLFNNRSCAAGIEVAAVSPFGEIYGCVVSPANDSEDSPAKRLFIAGNVKDGRFMDTWLDSGRWKIYRDLNLNKCRKCISCKHYAKYCFGNCVVDSYTRGGKPDAESPLCFADEMRVSI